MTEFTDIAPIPLIYSRIHVYATYMYVLKSITCALGISSITSALKGRVPSAVCSVDGEVASSYDGSPVCRDVGALAPVQQSGVFHRLNTWYRSNRWLNTGYTMTF